MHSYKGKEIIADNGYLELILPTLINEGDDIMAVTYTQYYNLGKQLDTSDKFLMSVITDNMDIIDTTMKDNAVDIAQNTSLIAANKNNILSIYNTGFAQKNVMHIVLDEVKALQSWATFINNTITFGNLAVTFNDDNSITLNGSHTADVAINFKGLSHINIPTNAVGAASANITLSNDIFFGLWGDSGVPNLVLNNGVDIPSDYASKYSRGFIIRVSANTVCNNVRIYPMVCDKALYQASPEVVPYAMSNAELTDKVETNKNNILSKAITGTCNTAAATAAKEVSIDGFVLVKGAIIGVKFGNTNSAANVTLNVNSTGAKSIYHNNAVYTGVSYQICGKKDTYTYYMYDGTYWCWLAIGENTAPAHLITTDTSTSITITGLDSTYNTNCILLCTDRRTSNAVDSVYFVSRYNTAVRVAVLSGNTTPSATISDDVITISGLRTYQTITVLAAETVGIAAV